MLCDLLSEPGLPDPGLAAKNNYFSAALLSDILQKLGDDSHKVRRGFQRGYGEASREAGTPPSVSEPDDTPAQLLAAPRPKRRRGLIGGFFHGIFRLLSLPLLLIAWLVEVSAKLGEEWSHLEILDMPRP